MTLKQKLYEDMKTAMKSQDAVRLGTIRFVLAAIKNVEIDRGEQTDEGVSAIIRSQVKQMKEAVEQFKQGNRDDLVDSETQKIAILEAYLPQQLDHSELTTIINQVIAENDSKELRVIMPAVMNRVAGRADGKLVAETVRQLLA